MTITIAGIEAPEATQNRYAELVAAIDHGEPVVADYVAANSDNAAGVRVFIVLEVKTKIDNPRNRKANTVGDSYFVCADCDGFGAAEQTETGEILTKSRNPQSFASPLVTLASDAGQDKVTKANLV